MEEEGKAGTILEALTHKKREWTQVPLADKIAMLQEIGERVTDWGAAYDAALQHMLIRKVDAVDEGSGMVAMYGALVGHLMKKSVDSLIKGLDQSYKVPSVDLKKEFQVESKYLAHETDRDGLTSSRTILFTETNSQRMNQKGHNQQSEVTVILGAGNHAIISILDVLYWTFVQGNVCVLKHNPIQASMISHVDHFLRPLIRAGFLISINASLELTSALIHHPLTDHVHLTGGIKTHDNIVFGTEDQETRKKEGRPVLRAKITSELGSITPYIVLPSAKERDTEWTDAAVAKQAADCAYGLLDNVSCNCIAAKVLVLPADWPDLSNRFLAALRKVLAAAPVEPAWYPGTRDRYQRWLDACRINGAAVDVFADARPKRVGGAPGAERFPVCLADLGALRQEDLGDLSAAFRDLSWTKEEPFAPVLSVVRVPGAALGDYADAAFRLADAHLWGNLSCSILAPDSAVPAVMQRIVGGRPSYGSYAINCPANLAFNPTGYWGGPAGRNRLADAQSGLGNVFNLFMFDTPRFAVVHRRSLARPACRQIVAAEGSGPRARRLCGCGRTPTCMRVRIQAELPSTQLWPPSQRSTEAAVSRRMCAGSCGVWVAVAERVAIAGRVAG